MKRSLKLIAHLKTSPMTRKIIVLLIVLSVLPYSYSQAQQINNQRQRTLKERILLKIDSINQMCQFKLRPRDKVQARITLNGIVDLVDQMDNQLRERERVLVDRERILNDKEVQWQEKDLHHDRDRNGSRDQIRNRDQNQNQDRDRYQNQNDKSDQEEVTVSPMSFEEFDQLMLSLEQTSFDQDKKKVVRTACLNNYFMVDQAIKLASKFSFDNDRLDVIETLYPHLLDQDKNYLLYNCFTFSDAKNKLETFIQGNNQNIHPHN